MLGALGTGRIYVMFGATVYLEACLKISLRFSAMRQQFGKPNEPEQSIIEYPMQQYRLFPLLGKVITFKFA
jgi:acyl-CoA oxidase